MEIETIARRGKRLQGKYFDLRIWYDNSLEIPKFSIAVSKKIDKRAVVRNTIKRKFRAAIYSLLKETFFKKASYLFIVKNVEVKMLKSQEIAKLIKEFFI